MSDTSAPVEQRFRSLLMKKSGEERLKMGASMFDSAKSLALAWFQAEGKSLSSAGQKAELFQRFYGQDYHAGSRQAITEWFLRRET